MNYRSLEDVKRDIEVGEVNPANLWVEWSASEACYTVLVIDSCENVVLYEYWAGNSPWDSKQVVEDNGLSESTLREHAQQTAGEIAEELDLPPEAVFEDEGA